MASPNLQGGSVLPNIADLIKADPPEFGSDTAPPFDAVLAYATRLLGPLRRARVLPLAAEEAEMQIVMEPHQAPELESLVPLAKEIGTSLAKTRLILANRMSEGRLKPDLRMFLALCLLLRLHPKFVPIQGETSMPTDLPTEPSAEPEADQAASPPVPPVAELEQVGGTELEQPEQPGASEQPGAGQEAEGQAEIVEAVPEVVNGAVPAPAQGFFAFAVEAKEQADEALVMVQEAASSANAVLRAGGDTAAVWPVLQEAEGKLDSARQTLEKVKAAVKRVEDEAAEKEARRLAELERQKQREEARQAAADAKALAKAAKEAAREAAAIAKQAAQDAKLKAQEAAEKEKTAREAQLKLAQTSRQGAKRGAAQASAPAPASRGRPGKQGSMIATAGKEVEDERRGRLAKRLARGSAGERTSAKPKPGPKQKSLSIEDFSRLASVPDKVVLRLVRERHLATTATKPKVLIERKAADEFVERYVSIEEIRKGAHGDEIEVALTAGQVPPVLSFPRGGVAFYERGYVKSLMEAFS